MEMLQMFLWIVYPYTVAAIVVMGLVWQYDTSREDGARTKAGKLLGYTVKGLMFVCTATGISIVLSDRLSNEPVQLLKWLISLAQLRPDKDLILDVSMLSKIHFISVFLFLLILAFTKEISYLLKPHLYLKKVYLKLQFERRS